MLVYQRPPTYYITQYPGAIFVDKESLFFRDRCNLPGPISDVHPPSPVNVDRERIKLQLKFMIHASNRSGILSIMGQGNWDANLWFS